MRKRDRVALYEGAGRHCRCHARSRARQEPGAGVEPKLATTANRPIASRVHDCDEELILARPSDPVVRAKLDARHRRRALHDRADSRRWRAHDRAYRRARRHRRGRRRALRARAMPSASRSTSTSPPQPKPRARSACAIWAASSPSTSCRCARSRIAQQLEQAVRAAFAGDPWSVTFGALSRFGVFDLARSQLRAPLHEQLRDADGRLSTETVALMALRAIEREARSGSGRQIACTVAGEVKAWLDAASSAGVPISPTASACAGRSMRRRKAPTGRATRSMREHYERAEVPYLRQAAGPEGEAVLLEALR